MSQRIFGPILFGLTLSATLMAQTPQYPAFPSETPAVLNSPGDGFEYVRRVVMVPMRDGIKLHTVILLPRGAKNAPIRLTRTP